MKLIIFDLGNTLVKYKGVSLNWSEHYSNAISHSLSKQNIKENIELREKAISILKFYNTRENFRTFEVEEGEIIKKVAKVFTAKEREFEKDFFQYFQRQAILNKTCENTLKRLREEEYKIAVLTDVPYGMPKKYVLKDLKEIRDQIDLILTSCDVGYRKPDVTGISMIRAEFDIKKEFTYFIGDERKDIECANQSGINSVLLSENIYDWGQDYTIYRIEDIFTII